jgi:hypothetical protein
LFAIVVPLAIVGIILIAILLALAARRKKNKKNTNAGPAVTSAARQDNFESARLDPDEQYGTLPRDFGESSYVSLKTMAPSVHSEDYLSIPSTAGSEQLGRGYERVPNLPQGAMYDGAPHVSQIARIEVSDFSPKTKETPMILSLVVVGTLAISATAASFPDFTAWNELLSSATYLNTSGELQGVPLTSVNYPAVANSSLVNASVAALDGAFNVSAFSHAEFLAFFVNAYNILAVRTILEHPCQQDVFGDCGSLPGIRLVSSLFHAAVWTLPAGSVANQTVSLDDIEATLRNPRSKGFDFDEDARIHSAIVCASISCPNLHNAAFLPATVDAQLNDTMRTFMANPKKGFAFDNYTNTVLLSAIFDFFPADFKPTPLDFALRFVNDSTRAAVQNRTEGQTVSFFAYNWDLNGEQMPCAASRACFTDLDALITGVAALLTVLLCVCCCVVKRRRERTAAGFTKV